MKDKELKQALDAILSGMESIRSMENWEDKQKACSYMSHRLDSPEVQKRTLYTSYSKVSMKDYCNGLCSYLFPRNENFLKLIVSSFKSDSIVDKIPGARDWLDRASRTMTHIATHNGFHEVMENTIKDGNILGLGYIAEMENDDTIIQFQKLDPFEVYVEKDDNGLISMYMRKFKLSVYDAYRKYGLDNLPEEIRRQFNRNEFTEKHDFKEAIFLQKSVRNLNTGIPFDITAKKYAHVIFSDTGEDFVVKDGFDEMPIYTWGADNTGGDYSKGKVEDSIEDVVILDNMSFMRMKLQQKNVDPAWAAPYSLEGGFSTKPGSINYLSDMTQLPKPLVGITDINSFLTDLQDQRVLIDRIFGTDLIRTIMDNRKDRTTATEVNMSKNESLIIMGNSIDNMISSVVQPMFMRMLRILLDRKILTDMPVELYNYYKNGMISVELDGTFINRVRIWTKADAIIQSVNLATQYSQIDPTVLRNLKRNTWFREAAVGLGCPSSILEELDKVEKEQDDDAVAQQNQMAVQDGLVQSEIQKNLRG